VTDVVSSVAAKRDLISRPAAKGVSFGVSLLTHFFMKNSFSLGWMLGELNDVAIIGAKALANAITGDDSSLQGIIGRRYGQDVGGIIGRRFGQDVGQVTGSEADELRRLRERLSGSRAMPVSSASGNGVRRASFTYAGN